MSAEKTEKGYTVFAPCGTCIGEIKFYLSVSGKLMYDVKGEIQKTLPAAAKILAAEFYAAKHAAHVAEIEAADADAQAAEQVESEQSAAFEDVVIAKQCCAKNLIGEIFFVSVGDILFFDKEKQSFAAKLFTEGEQQPDIIYISPAQANHVVGAQQPAPVATPAPVAVPTPAKRIVGKADGSAEITTADGVTTIAPRNGERDELEVLEQQHGIEIMPIEFPANGVDLEYAIVQNDTEIGVIYFVEGAGYCPLYRSQRGLIPASGMQTNIGGAIEKLMQKIKELGVPENAPKARRPLPEDLQTAQSELAKVDSLAGLNNWWISHSFNLLYMGEKVIGFGQFDHPEYIYITTAAAGNSLILKSQIGKTLTASPK